jgi:hypothetical protein
MLCLRCSFCQFSSSGSIPTRLAARCYGLITVAVSVELAGPLCFELD